MLGAIIGDVVGSVYESHPIKTTAFPLFTEHSRYTDDTVLTVAVAHAILSGQDYAPVLKAFGRRYPRAGYGASFARWLSSPENRPYNSWGNGAAMRVSPVGFAFDDPALVLEQARRSAAATHNHPEGIKGAQALALAVFLARRGADKAALREEIEGRFGYDLHRTVGAIRPGYSFDVSCQGSVPEALVAFLDSEDFEEAVRLAVSLGGDSDTLACMAGAVAQAHYGSIPETLAREADRRLPPEFLDVITEFQRIYPQAAPLPA